MIKKINLAIISCLVLFSFITEKVNLVYADITASIDVIYHQEFIDKDGKKVANADRELLYELVPSKPNNPLPAGSVGGVYGFALKGNISGSLTITASEPGEYEYTLKASDKNDLHGLIPASEMSYRIVVSILKTMDGELKSFAFAFNEDGEKIADPPFIYTIDDTYVPPTTPKPEITPRPTRKPLLPINRPGQGGTAKTGDTTKIYTLIALALASSGVIFLAVVKRRKRDEEE